MEAARYYESKPGQQDKAVMLYHKVRNCLHKQLFAVSADSFQNHFFSQTNLSGG